MFSDGGDEIAGRVIFGIADDAGFAAERTHHLAFGDGLFSVVRAFAVHVGTESIEERGNVDVVEDDDDIDALECRDQLGSIHRAQDGSARAFEFLGDLVAVDSDDEDVTHRARAFEIANVADVQQVEVTVREHDTLMGALRVFDESGCVFQGDDGAHCTHCLTASASSSRETVAVPRFITTMPPA